MVVPDNLLSGLSRACRYDPELNLSYQQLPTHYQVAVLSAGPDKPKAGVQVVERWILARYTTITSSPWPRPKRLSLPLWRYSKHMDSHTKSWAQIWPHSQGQKKRPQKFSVTV